LKWLVRQKKRESAPAATVGAPTLLHAAAKAVSARQNTSPPCAIAWPLTMSGRTVMRATARPSPHESTTMPSARDASSDSIIAATGSLWRSATNAG